MHIIYADNPDHGLAQGLQLLAIKGSREESRNGPVLVAPGPVATVYPSPWNHVSFSHARDANPFFHLAEAMWMLLGRHDVATVSKFAANMKQFSDDGKSLWGAYGYRWRHHFNNDQLDAIVRELVENPKSRRAVLSMWDGDRDPGVAVSGGKDVPCNTHAYFWVANGALHMTVCCRSNDIVWGAYGANVVHFSILLQYMAERIGVGIGTYTQMSNNYHAYIDRPDVKELMALPAATSPKYPSFSVPKLLRTGADDLAFLNDADGALGDPLGRTYTTPFIRDVFVPMLMAHAMHKAKHSFKAIELLSPDKYAWHLAAVNWLQRRVAKLEAKQETR